MHTQLPHFIFESREKLRLQRILRVRQEAEIFQRLGVEKKRLSFRTQREVFEALDEGFYQNAFRFAHPDGTLDDESPSVVLDWNYKGMTTSNNFSMFFNTKTQGFVLEKEHFIPGNNWVLLGRWELLKALCLANVLKLDATYNTSPRCFAASLTICCNFGGYNLPVAR